MSDLKEELHRTLRASRAALLSKLDGTSDYDRRRPMTPTGTNLLGLVKPRAGGHADGVISALDLASPGSVAHWPEDRRDTTLGALLIRMVAETAQHAGHADIVRELIDGKGGPDQDGFDETTWLDYLAQVQAAANTFATGSPADA